MIIANAEFVDLPSILELQKLCYRENAIRYDDFTIPPLMQTIKELQNEFETNIILKVEEQSEIIGSIRAYEKDGTCFIGRVVVHPDHQNKGIGKKMMMEIENRFQNVLRFELFTGFKDEKNINFYEKLDYTVFKEETHGNTMKFVFLEKIANR